MPLALPLRIVVTVPPKVEDSSFVRLLGQLEEFLPAYNEALELSLGIERGKNLHQLYRKEFMVWVQEGGQVDAGETGRVLHVARRLGFSTTLIASVEAYALFAAGEATFICTIDSPVIYFTGTCRERDAWDAVEPMLVSNRTSPTLVGKPTRLLADGVLSSSNLSRVPVRVLSRLHIDLQAPDLLHIQGGWIMA